MTNHKYTENTEDINYYYKNQCNDDKSTLTSELVAIV